MAGGKSRLDRVDQMAGLARQNALNRQNFQSMTVTLGTIPGDQLRLQQSVLAAQLCQGIATFRIRRGNKPIAGPSNMAPLQHQFRVIGDNHSGKNVLSLGLHWQKHGNYRYSRACKPVAECITLP